MGFSVSPQADRTFQFFDHHLMESIELGDPKVHEFLRLLALCHTVMSEENSAGKCSVSESCFLDRYIFIEMFGMFLYLLLAFLCIYLYTECFLKIWRDLKEKIRNSKKMRA